MGISEMFLCKLLFVVLLASQSWAKPLSVVDKKNQNIEILELMKISDLDNFYRSAANYQKFLTNKKSQSMYCKKDLNCKKKVDSFLMSQGSPIVIKNKMDQIIINSINQEFSSEQIAWLLKVYKQPLFDKFNKFIKKRELSNKLSVVSESYQSDFDKVIPHDNK